MLSFFMPQMTNFRCCMLEGEIYATRNKENSRICR